MAYGTVKVDNITFDNGGSDQNVTVSGLYRATTSGVTLSGTIAATTVSGVTIIGSTTVSGATVTGTTANFTSGNFSNIISSAATMSGALIIANQQQVQFREAVGNGVNHIALQAPAIVSADQTITLPDQTGTVVTTGDNGSVTSTMILAGTILNSNINASAGIVDTKLATIATAGKVSNSATTATNANTASAIVARDASGNFTAGTITAALTGAASSNVLKAGDTMTGVLAVTAGTAALPGLAIASDLNTGIYSPGADQLAVSTGGTGRLFVDSSGKVGIGVGSPGATFDLAAGAGASVTAVLIRSVAANANGFQIVTDSTTDNVYLNNFYNAALRFGTNNTERARIDSSGRVGIGTSVPRGMLSIANNADTSGAVDSSLHFGYTTSDYYGFRIVNSNDPSSTAAGLLKIQRGTASNWTDAVVVNNNGNVGIGTTSPGTTLDVAGSPGTSTTANLFTLRNQSASNAGNIAQMQFFCANTFGGGEAVAAIQALNPNASANNGGALVLAVSSNGTATTPTERARIDSSGNVGIGTSSPQSLLHVEQANVNQNLIASAGNAVFRMADSATSGTRKEFTITLDNTNNRVDIQAVQQGVATRNITLNSGGGNVGIGTTGPTALLELSGSGIVFKANTTTTTSTSTSIQIGGLTTTSNSGCFLKSYTNLGSTLNSSLAFEVNGGATEAARIDGSGNVGIGTSSPSANLHISSGGNTEAIIGAPSGSPIITMLATGAGAGIFGYQNLLRFGTVTGAGGAGFLEAVRIDSSGRLLVGTSTGDGKLTVKHDAASAVEQFSANIRCEKLTVVRGYSVVSLGTKLIIPFVSQVIINTVTTCKVWGLDRENNSTTPKGFEITFAVHSVNSLTGLQSWGGNGNYASIAINGMNVEITFTTAYAGDGVAVCIEYMAAHPNLSIDVANIAMN
jgi:hypothetical protein